MTTLTTTRPAQAEILALLDDASAYTAIVSQVGFVPGVTGGHALEGILSGESSISSIVAASPSDISPSLSRGCRPVCGLCWGAWACCGC